MVILNQRRIITPKNIVLLGIILLSTYTYSTEFKLLSLKTFKPVAQLNSKFAQLKFDKLLIQSIKSAKSFPALRFKHVTKELTENIIVESAKSFAALKFKHAAEEDPEHEKKIVIKEYRSQEEAKQLLQQKKQAEENAMLLLKNIIVESSVESVESAKSFAALNFKHVTEEDLEPAKKIVIKKDLLQEKARQLLKQKQELHKQQQKAMLLLKKLTENIKEKSIIQKTITEKFNTDWKDIICKDSDPNIMLPNGNTFFYQLLKNIEYDLKNINDHYTYHDQIEFISLCLSQQDWQHGKPDMTIKNKKGNTILHQIMKLFNCNPLLNRLTFDTLQTDQKINYTLYFPGHKEKEEGFEEGFLVNGNKKLWVNGALIIPNLNQALKIKNNNNMTPLYYLFTKFHPIQPTQIARRCIKRIRNIQKYIDKNGNDINSLINHIATEKYSDIFQISYKDIYDKAQKEFEINPIERLFSLNKDYGDHYKKHLVVIDDSLLPLKKKMKESPFYKMPQASIYRTKGEKDCFALRGEICCQLRATKDYVDHKAKKPAKKRAMLNFLMACKTRFNKNLLLPTPLKKCIFELIPLLSFELITPLSAALNTIITKREKNTLIIKDDLDCLIDAAAKSTLFS